MSRVRVLVGTRKGAFVLEADGQRKKWNVSGPHFGGWEIYHVKGSPADPERLFASQSNGWFGQIIRGRMTAVRRGISRGLHPANRRSHRRGSPKARATSSCTTHQQRRAS